jgi:hypothetical protein
MVYIVTNFIIIWYYNICKWWETSVINLQNIRFLTILSLFAPASDKGCGRNANSRILHFYNIYELISG